MKYISNDQEILNDKNIYTANDLLEKNAWFSPH